MAVTFFRLPENISGCLFDDFHKVQNMPITQNQQEDLREHFDWTSNETVDEWLEDYRQRLPESYLYSFLKIQDFFESSVTDEMTTPVGEPLRKHLLRTAAMVEQLNLLPEAVWATLCSFAPYYVEHWKEKIQEIAGKQVLNLVTGIHQLHQLTEFVKPPLNPIERAKQAETMRKMLLAMVSDIRVVLIKLAMRTRTMQFLGRIPDNPQKQAIAKETLDIFAPLANRLGVWQLKWQLEDLGFRYQNPEEYRVIAEELKEKRDERLAYVAEFSGSLKQAMNDAGVICEVVGRPKHIYSIYRKMQRKHLSFSGLYDIRAVRVLVHTVAECYAALGVVHSLWQPIPGEFDDYIAHPKPNDYQSLHTVVIGPENKGVEIQIRTFEMHEFAEFGVAAHWRYKEGGASDGAYEQKIAWLRQLLDWRENMATSDKEDLAVAFQTELFNDTIYVLTPQGRVLSLPEGATPIDFAYELHTDLGNRCRGAKVNGHMVPLSTPLENGQRVEILAAKTGDPSPDWLHQGWVKSSKAISKIRAYIRSLSSSSIKEHGKSVLDKILAKQNIPINIQKLTEECGYRSVEDLHLAIGQNEISHKTIENAIKSFMPVEKETLKPRDIIHTTKAQHHDSNGILINGESGLLTTLAKCCRPAPPDEIVGFVTREKGVSIHRQGCVSFEHLAEEMPEKVLSASWSNGSNDNIFAVDLEIQAHDRNGLLRDVSDILSKNKINVIGVQTRTRDFIANMDFTIEIKQVDKLPAVLSQLMEINNVMSVRRK